MQAKTGIQVCPCLTTFTLFVLLKVFTGLDYYAIQQTYPLTPSLW